MVITVVVDYVPSFSATIDDDQYQYLLSTKNDDQSKSERLRELLHKGISEESND